MIDPEFWSDEEISKWSFQARLFYIGLWNFADDKGRLKAHSNLLKSQIFPYERRINVLRLRKEIEKKVLWYEVNGQKYGFIRNFLKYQRIDRPTDSRLPPPPSEIDEGSMSTRRRLAPNIIEVNISKDNTTSPAHAGEEGIKTKASITTVVDYYQAVKGFDRLTNWGRHAKAAKTLLNETKDVEIAKRAIKWLANTYDRKGLDWKLETVISKLPEYFKERKKVEEGYV